MYTNIPDRVAKVRTVVENIKNESVLKLLTGFGLKEPYIKSCGDKFSKLETLVEKQHAEQKDIRSAYDAYNRKTETCGDNYHKTLDFVRLKIKSMDGARERINTSRIASSPVEKMFEEVLAFYRSVLKEPELVSYLVQFNITPDTYIQDIEEAKRLRSAVFIEKGEAEDATETRNKALIELEDICTEIKTVAKYALKDNPQLLEKLGIKVR